MGLTAFVSVRDLVPDRLFARALLLRAVGIWVFVRIATLIAESAVRSSMPGAGLPAPSLFIAPLMAAGVGVLVALLLLIDVRRRGEHVLLANLGTGTRDLLAFGVALAFVLEVAMGVAGAVMGAAA